jgi:N-acetylneuraminate synthase
MTDAPPLTFAGRPVGIDHPPLIVAELSGNHNGRIERAIAILDAAAEAGADAVKLQTYTADTMTIDCDRPDFLVQDGLWKGRRLHELYQEAHTPWEWHEALFRRGRELGIAVFSTPFDATAVDFLEELGAPFYKVASFEAVDLPLVERIASTGKPIILSTGMSDLGEIQDAVDTARRSGAAGLVLLHCISAYPAPAEQMNLQTMRHLATAFDVLPGLSDHTLGTAAAVAATALGATVIEKHVTLARADGGVDSAFSLEPGELRRLVEDTRTAHAALGRVTYDTAPAETASMTFRRSIYAVADIAAGEPFTDANVRIIRPGFGLPPKAWPIVLDSRATRDIGRGEPLRWGLVEGS